MPPRIGSFCDEFRSFGRYVDRLHKSIIRVLQRYEKDGSGLVVVSFAEGPRVASVCYADFEPALTEFELTQIATAASEVGVPRRLACFSGHRLEHRATLDPVDWFGDSPPP
jgi:hypothetical protein